MYMGLFHVKAYFLSFASFVVDVCGGVLLNMYHLVDGYLFCANKRAQNRVLGGIKVKRIPNKWIRFHFSHTSRFESYFFRILCTIQTNKQSPFIRCVMTFFELLVTDIYMLVTIIV